MGSDDLMEYCNDLATRINKLAEAIVNLCDKVNKLETLIETKEETIQ